MSLRVILLGALLSASGCVHTRSSAVPSDAAKVQTGPVDAARVAGVKVRAMEVPEGATDLGVVEANGLGGSTIEDVVAEFRLRVASLGGNYAKVDSVKTKFETVTQTYSYTCGKSTCTGMRSVEVSTLSVLGRAFQVEVTPP